MDQGMKPTTLAERVYAMIAAEDNGARDMASKPLIRGDEIMSEYEADLVDWGMTYGMAFALARREEPCESNQSVAKRALDAAKSVWAEWSGGVWNIRRPEAFAAFATFQQASELDDGQEQRHRERLELREAVA